MSERLNPDELRARFEQRVIPDYIEPQRGGARGSASSPPRFVSVGGQPGAGKGGVLADMRRQMPGAVVVNGDELRQFHPAYERLMREDPLRMPEVTGHASGPWVGMSNEYLRGQGSSAIVETTLRDAAMLRSEFEAFKAAGYETELRVVAVPLEVSRAGTVSRYVEQVKDFGAGRWTPSTAHDEAAANVRETVRELAASGAVDRVVVQNRDGRVFYDAPVTVAGVECATAAVEAVDEARDVRNLSPVQAQSWIATTTAALHERYRLGNDPTLSENARRGHNDVDLVKTSKRLATMDAEAVVPQAFPGDKAAQNKALADLSEAAKVTLSDRLDIRADALRAARFPDGDGDVTRTLGRGKGR
ncbi:MAG: zeta toxin family protein [Microbacterium sp.]